MTRKGLLHKVYNRNRPTVCCISSAILASAWLDVAISSIEADCSSVAADTVCVCPAVSRLMLSMRCTDCTTSWLCAPISCAA